jgi:hypothetical protein
MTDDLESSLRAELTARAAATTTSPDALAGIVERSRAMTPRSTWRRPVLALVGAIVVLVAAVTLATRDSEHRPAFPEPQPEQPPYTGPLPPVRPLPDRPPDAAGAVSGQAGTGCLGDADCVGGRPARVDLPDVGAPEELPHPDTVELSDGRRFEFTPTGGTAPWGELGMPETWLVDPANGSRLSLGAGSVEAAAALPDGRIAAIWFPITEDPVLELRIVDAQARSTRVDLPDGFQPSEIAGGPDGWYAVLGTLYPCCPRQLLLVAPDGAQRRLVLDRDGQTASGVQISWGEAGLIAVSPLIPRHPEEGDGGSWVTVVDPNAGEIVASIDGWLGTAWSPDGTGLLVARLTGEDTARLAVLWGPGLAERTDVGTVPAAFTPHAWTPPTGQPQDTP